MNDESSATLRVSALATYSAKQWSSVGWQADYTVSNEKVLRLVGTRTEYLHPENMNNGTTGGDEAREILTFEAVSEGKCMLTIRELFRGKLTGTKQISVTVEK